MKLLFILSLLALSVSVFAAAETCTGAMNFNGDKPIRSSSFKTAPGCYTTGTGTLLFYIKDMAAKAKEAGLSEVSIELMGTRFTKDIIMILDSTNAPQDMPLKFTMADSSMIGDDRQFMSLMGAFPKNSSIQIIRNSFTKDFDGPPVAAETGYSLFGGPKPSFSLTGSEYLFARNNVTISVVRGRTAFWSGSIEMTQNSRWIVAGNRIKMTPYCWRILLKHAGIMIVKTLAVTDSSMVFDRNEFDLSSNCPLSYVPYIFRVDEVFHVIRGSMLWTNNNIKMVGNHLLGITPGSVPTSFLSFKSISNADARMTLEYNSSFLVENNNMHITAGVVVSALPDVVIAISGNSKHAFTNNCITLDNNRNSFAMNAWNLGRTQLSGGALRFENTTLKVVERWPASFLWVDRISYLSSGSVFAWNGNQQVKTAYNRPFETPVYFNRAEFSGGVIEFMNNYLSATAPAYEGSFINLPRFALNSGSVFRIINNYVEALCTSRFGAMRLALVGSRSDDWGSPMIAEGKINTPTSRVVMSCNKVRLVPHERHWRTPVTRLWTTVTTSVAEWANGCTAKRMTSLVIEAGVNAAEVSGSGYTVFDRTNRNSLFSGCLMPYVTFLNPVPACSIPTRQERAVCIKAITDDTVIPGYPTTAPAPTTAAAPTVAPTTAKPAEDPVVPAEPATSSTTAKPTDGPAVIPAETTPSTTTATADGPAVIPAETTPSTTTATADGPAVIPAETTPSTTTAKADVPVIIPAETTPSTTTAKADVPVIIPAETTPSTTTAKADVPVIIPAETTPNTTTAKTAGGPVIIPAETTKQPTPAGEHCITICSAAPLHTDGEVCPSDAAASGGARVFGAQQEARVLEKTTSSIVTRRDEVCVLCIVVPVVSIVTLVIAIATGVIICHFNRCFRTHQKEIVA